MSQKRVPSRRKELRFWFDSANDIIERRKKLGMNQRDFWARIGITQSGGSRYESGRNVPRPVKFLLQLAYGTEQQSAQILGDLRRPPEKSPPPSQLLPRGFGILP